jgi:hypothetical protein
MHKKQLLPLLICILAQSVQAQNLISSTYKGQRTKEQLNTQFGLPIFQYNVKYYKVLYTSTDAAGALDTLSGLVAMPQESSSAFPLLVYQHGTSDCKTCVPSRFGSAGGDEGQVGLVFAGMGYVTLMPDYVGMGDGRGFHPYVHAATEASAAVDMVRSAGAFLQQYPNYYKNNQLFITGYSQGGHAAMALHRSMETQLSSEFMVTAAAPMSGPYSISGSMRDLILSDEPYYYLAYLPNTALSYQTMYGNLYTSLDQLFKPAYTGFIQQWYNGAIKLNTLNTNLIQTLTAQTGGPVAHRMLQDSIVEAITNNPQHPINVALRDNDVYNWTPTAPTALFYCTADDQVPYQNSIVARDTMLANGVTNLTVTDVDPAANHGGCVIPAITQTLAFFAQYQSIIPIQNGTDDKSVWNEVKVSPNPANEHMTVMGLPSRAYVRLLDTEGREVIARQWADGSSITLNTSRLNNGTYVLMMGRGKSGSEVARLVVVREF